MRIMEPHEQANWLVGQIRGALAYFNEVPRTIVEDEVIFRIQTIHGLLKLLMVDALGLRRDWEQHRGELETTGVASSNSPEKESCQ